MKYIYFLNEQISIDTLNEILTCNDSDLLIFKSTNNNFCTGLDISKKDEINEEFLNIYILVIEKLKRHKVPIISLIQGCCLGGGMMFPLLSDIVIASENASFGFPEIKHGFLPGLVSLALEHKKLNSMFINQMVYSGNSINSESALKNGLITDISNDLDDKLSFYLKRFEKVNVTELKKIPFTSFIDAKETMMKVFNVKIPSLKNNLVLLEEYNSYCIITLNNPTKFNALNDDMCNELTDVVRYVGQKQFKCVILKGNGKHFCVGGDITMKDMKQHTSFNLYYPFKLLRDLNIPIISICKGKLIGGGLAIIQNTDIRIGTKDVTTSIGWITRNMTSGMTLANLLSNNKEGTRMYLTNKFLSSLECVSTQLLDYTYETESECLSKSIELATFICQSSSNMIKYTMKNIRTQVNSNKIFDEIFELNESSFKFNKDQMNDSIIMNHSLDECPNKTLINNTKNILKYAQTIGIKYIEAYIPKYAITQKNMEIHDNQINKYTKGLKQEAIGFVDENEDVVSMCLTLVNRMMNKYNIPWDKIGRLEVGTESSVDRSKSVKTFLMRLFNQHGVYDVEGVDTYNACYGGTAALLNTINWLKSTDEDKYGLVLTADICSMPENMLFFGGAAAVCMLVTRDGPITFDQYRSSCMKDTYDFYKPVASTEPYPIVQDKHSIECYLDSLKICIDSFKKKSGIQNLSTHYDYLVFHSPNSNMAYKGTKVLLENDFPNQKVTDQEVRNVYESKTEPSLFLTKNIGSTYTVSVHLNLYSLLSTNTIPNGSKILLYSYGSGAAATMWSVTKQNEIDIYNPKNDIENRIYKTASEYIEISKRFNDAFSKYNFKPLQDFIEDNTYYLSHIDDTKQRYYECYKPTYYSTNVTQHDTPTKTHLKEESKTHSAAIPSIALDTNIKPIIEKIMKEQFGDKVLDWNKPLLESGMDSLSAVEFHDRLQVYLNITLPETIVFDYPTLNEIHNFLLSLSVKVEDTVRSIEIANEGSIEWENEIGLSLTELKKIVSIKDGEVNVNTIKNPQLNSKALVTLFVEIDETSLIDVKTQLKEMNKEFMSYKPNKLVFKVENFD